MKRQRRLTGRYFFKRTWIGMVLMVEHYQTVSDFVGDQSPDIGVWSKATQQDVFNLGMFKFNSL